MPTFKYKGRDSFGKAVSGQLDGISCDLVAGQLSGRGITPTTIQPYHPSQSLEQLWQQWSNDRHVELIELPSRASNAPEVAEVVTAPD